MLREPALLRYAFHILYGGHNAIPHNNDTKLREVDSLAYPLAGLTRWDTLDNETYK